MAQPATGTTDRFLPTAFLLAGKLRRKIGQMMLATRFGKRAELGTMGGKETSEKCLFASQV
ncbi:MAG: hypothetical protein MKZ95_06865 [Pirellulales bacterium]|nr:hypothetical protein [Pirellulales bacterium]